jgi:hypothetical protein
MLGLLDIEGGNVEDPPIGQVFFRGAFSDARVVEATWHLEVAAVAVGDGEWWATQKEFTNGEWWATQKEFTNGTLGTFQDKLDLKGTGQGDTHVQYLASRFSMSVALLVSTFTEMGEGVDPVMLYKLYELSDVTRPFQKIALLHLRDTGVGGHFEAVLCDGIGPLSSDHECLQALRAQFSI